MTKEQLDKELERLDNECKTQKLNIEKAYALEHNPYKVGDILKRYGTIVKVTHIDFTRSFGANVLVCTYSGIKLTKKLLPFKSTETDNIWQGDSIELLVKA